MTTEEKNKLVKACLIVGFTQEEIDEKFQELDRKTNWRPLSVKELMELDPKEHKHLLSMCWHEGDFRCKTIGITDLEITPCTKMVPLEEGFFNLSWSDGDGDPHLEYLETNELIDNVGDGEWNYGLYIKTQTLT